MRDSFQLKAFILERRSFRENDGLITVYSEEKGRLSLMARGIKKKESKMVGHLEPFNLVNIVATRGENWDYLIGISTRNSFIDLKNNLDKLEASGSAFYWFKKIIKENQADKKVFTLLDDFLNSINDASGQTPQENYIFKKILFLIKLLQENDFQLDDFQELKKDSVINYLSNLKWTFSLPNFFISEKMIKRTNHLLEQYLPLILKNN